MAEANPRRQQREAAAKAKAPKVTPRWWVPVMVTLMLIGLLWVVIWYLSEFKYPIGDIGAWNLGIGFGIIMIGFGMTMNWK